MSEKRVPVLVGVGQVLQKDIDFREARSAIGLMNDAVRAAAEDAGGAEALLDAVDTLAVVNILCWDHVDAPKLLAEQLGISPKKRIYTAIGGNTPNALVNTMAARIADGQAETVVIAGAEAFHSGRAAHRAGEHPGWATADRNSSDSFGDSRLGLNDTESRHGLMRPSEIYPMFETALRAADGHDAETHALNIGRTYAPFTEVAAKNPFAWFREVRSAEDIATVSKDNRYVGFPYTKRMNAIMMVDQAAAVIMTTEANARRLGIDPSLWVYPVGGGDAHDHWFVSERLDFTRSPAMQACAESAYEMAGIGAEQLDYVDIYSCFPCAVRIGYRETGLEAASFTEQKGRALTLTGGLPYHGGPGNNYGTHGIAEAVLRVRAHPGSYAMTTGVGWFMTKHGMSVFASEPGKASWQGRDTSVAQRRVDGQPKVRCIEGAVGVGTVEAYTVSFDRASQPGAAYIIGRMGDGSDPSADRFLAVSDTDAETIDALVSTECVGRAGRVRCEDNVNRFAFS